MNVTRHYDTVAFDVRENATMLFFARTNDAGEIEDYVLLMRAIAEDFEDIVLLEMNEQQLTGADSMSEASLLDCVLVLKFAEAIPELDGATELRLTFDNTTDNRQSIEVGVFRVLGDKLQGGHA